MSEFTGEVVLVTGAGSGIGRGLTRRLLQAGAKVGALDRDPQKLESLRAEWGTASLATAIADVTDSDQLSEAVRQLEERLGPTDRLIANAGIGQATGFWQFNSNDFSAIVQVNLVGVAHSLAAVLPGMMQRRRGHIIGISSLASYRGLPLMSAYCASKSGLNAMLESLAVEVAPLNIQVTTICPGWIRTPLTQVIRSPMPGILELETALDTMLTAIARRQRQVAFPPRSAMVVRFLRWLPTAWSDRLIGRRFHRHRSDPSSVSTT